LNGYARANLMRPTKSKTRFSNSCTPCGNRMRTSN